MISLFQSHKLYSVVVLNYYILKNTLNVLKLKKYISKKFY